MSASPADCHLPENIPIGGLADAHPPADVRLAAGLGLRCRDMPLLRRPFGFSPVLYGFRLETRCPAPGARVSVPEPYRKPVQGLAKQAHRPRMFAAWWI